MASTPIADTARTCARTGCRRPATASLSFRYATSQVWLLDLSEAADPSLYDLCPDHADALTVPRGWDRVDHRTSPAPAVVDPAAPDPDAPVPAGHTRGADPRVEHGPADRRHAPHAPAHRASRPPNRYAALSAELPRLAAQVAAGEAAGDAPGRGPRAVTASAPLAGEEGPPPEVDGQLAFADVLDDGSPRRVDGAPAGAVVVPIGAAGVRRREQPVRLSTRPVERPDPVKS